MARNHRVEIIEQGVRIDRVRGASSRSRTLTRRLWPALAVIVLAGSIALQRTRIQDWPGLGPIGIGAPAAEGVVNSAKSQVAAASKISIREREIFSKTVPTPPRPLRKPEPSAFAGLDNARLADKSDPAIIAEPRRDVPLAEPREIDPAVVQEQVRRESQEKRQEQADASKFKRDVVNWLKRDESRYMQERDRKLRDRAEQDRDEFHALLSQAIKLPDDKAARAIVKACAEHKGEIGAVTTARLRKMLEEVDLRGLSIPARIRHLRTLGIPEPYILGEIARSQYDRIGERDGPKSKAGVIANAARSVLHEKKTQARADAGPLKSQR